MIYNTEIEYEKNNAERYLKYLSSKGKIVEVKEIRKRRSLPQNAYFHVLCGIFGSDVGYTIPETKDLIKRRFNFTYEKNGYEFLKSTKDADTKEFSLLVDKFRNYSMLEHNCYLPTPDEGLKNHARFMQDIKNNRFL